MLRFMLGSWAVAGVVIGSLLTAVAQNPPPVPDGDAESQQQQQQEQDGQSPADSSQPASQNQQNQVERPDSADQPQPARQESTRGQQRQDLRGADAALADESEDATEARSDLGIQFRTSNSGGLMISSLDRRGGASASGLREGDLIVSAGGRTFDSEQALREFLLSQSDQQQIPMVVMRDGRRETVYWSSSQPANQTPPENGDRPRIEQRFVQRQQPAGSPQRREVARPDFDLGRRVEQLESEVDALRRQVELLRERLNAIGGAQPTDEHGDGIGSAKRPD